MKIEKLHKKRLETVTISNLFYLPLATESRPIINTQLQKLTIFDKIRDKEGSELNGEPPIQGQRLQEILQS